MILVDLGHGDTGSGAFFKPCIVANNYYCLPNKLHTLKSLKCLRVAIDQLINGISDWNDKRELKNIISSKIRSLALSLVNTALRLEEAMVRVMLKLIFLIKHL